MRIHSIDVLRGVALLGILVMTIQAFSMPQAAYFNPTAYGDFTGANLYVWVAGRMLADQKFMTIFSMLFGAGIVLMTGRAEAAEPCARARAVTATASGLSVDIRPTCPRYRVRKHGPA